MSHAMSLVNLKSLCYISTCIVNFSSVCGLRSVCLDLESQVRLLARKQLVLRMRICIVCIRRAAHIKIVQTHMQTIMEMDMDIGVESVYIRAFGPWEISQSTSHSSIQRNTLPRLLHLCMETKRSWLCAWLLYIAGHSFSNAYAHGSLLLWDDDCIE
jgi:hypothetical protein